MKKTISILFIGIIIGAVILFFINKKCPLNGSNDLKNKIISDQTSTGSNNFESITSKLDSGGDLFFYLNTEKITSAIRKSFYALNESIIAPSKKNGGGKREVNKLFSFVNSLLDDSGLMDIAGIGISAKEFEENLTRTKFVIEHKQGKGNKLIWNFCIRESDNLESIDLLPKETAFASFSDFNYFRLWNWIKRQAEKSEDEKIRLGIGSVEKDLRNNGVDLPTLLKSINGDIGIIITLDRGNMKKIPSENNNSEFPDPAFALIIKTGNESIFKLIASKIPNSEINETKERKSISIKAPKMPFTFSPMIIQSKNLLILASTPDIAEKILNNNIDSGILKTDEFIKLSRGVALSGNGFTFMSSSLMKEIMKIQKNFDTSKYNSNKKGMEILEKLGLNFSNLSMFRVFEKTKTGYTITSNSTIRSELMLMMPVVALGGIVSAIVIPQVIRGKQRNINREEQSRNRLFRGL